MIKKFNLFVTTGSSLEFNDLIRIIDNLNKFNKYNVICQIGKGNYFPRNCNYFLFTENINKYYNWADIIITHTGGTTLSEICRLNKKAIAVSNPNGYKGIYEIAIHFDKKKYLKYVDFKDLLSDSNYLFKLIDDIIFNKIKFNKYFVKKQKIGSEIISYLSLK